VVAFDQLDPRRRRLFAGFEDDGVAGNQRGHDVTVGQMHREVIRAEYGQHAVRLVTQRRTRPHCPVETALRCAFVVRIDRNLDLGHHGLDFGLGLPKRLAGFARDRVGKVLGTGANDVDEPVQSFDPNGQRACGPFGPCVARLRDFGLDVAHVSTPVGRARGWFDGDDFG